MFCYLTKDHALNAKGFLGATGMIGMFFINGLSWFSYQLDVTSLKCSNLGKLLLHLAKSFAARGRRTLLIQPF